MTVTFRRSIRHTRVQAGDTAEVMRVITSGYQAGNVVVETKDGQRLAVPGSFLDGLIFGAMPEISDKEVVELEARD